MVKDVTGETSLEYGDSVRQIWDTDLVCQKERFSYFREGVCQAFLAFTPEETVGPPLEARLEKVDLPQGCVSRINVTPHRVIRTKSDVARITCDFVSLDFQRKGNLIGNIGGVPYAEAGGVGNVTLVDSSRIDHFDINQNCQHTSLFFDRSKLIKPAALQRFISVGGPYLSALQSCFSVINRNLGHASQGELQGLFDASLSLLNSFIITDPLYLEHGCEFDSVSKGLLRAIKHFIDVNIANPSLSTPEVGRHFGVSPRYIQKLFASDNLTFKSYLLGRRLDQVYAELIDKSVATKSISDIAYKWGFRDRGTFSRNFKSRFVDTPAQVRARQREVALV